MPILEKIPFPDRKSQEVVIEIRRFDVIRHKTGKSYPRDFDEFSIDICKDVNPFSLTGSLGVNVLVQVVRYVIENNIEGFFSECGVL
jgi:hypothetical protein